MIIFVVMITNDRYVKFCKDFAMYLGRIINYKTKLVYYGFENRTASVYISIKDTTDRLDRIEMSRLCTDFKAKEDLKGPEIRVTTVFEFKGIATVESGYDVAMFEIDENVLNRYRFDENLMKSLTTKNKFNL